MKFSEELQWRGLVGQTTIDDLSTLDTPGRKFYLGADPSADSMTIGNLAALVTCIRFIKAGHKAVLLAGGATGMAGGDPDGKDETRAKIDEGIISERVELFKKQYHKIFRGYDIEIVNNYDWFKNINYIDFLRNIGWHFSMTQLLDRDFIKKRIGEGGKGINYAEFSYSLIQGYDYLHLYREKNVTIQLCGVDQFGNCTSGMHLVSKLEGAKVDVFGMPLVINKSTGRKFGKSESGAIWLDESKTSIYDFYQFWLNCDDVGVVDYLKIYTFLSPDEIADIDSEHQSNPAARIAQKILAREVTSLVHGVDNANAVIKATDVLFNNLDIKELDQTSMNILKSAIPCIAVGQSLVEVLVSAGLASSRSEARRLLSGKAVSINGQKVIDDVIIEQPSLIKKGKNQFALVY